MFNIELKKYGESIIAQCNVNIRVINTFVREFDELNYIISYKYLDDDNNLMLGRCFFSKKSYNNHLIKIKLKKLNNANV